MTNETTETTRIYLQDEAPVTDTTQVAQEDSAAGNVTKKYTGSGLSKYITSKNSPRLSCRVATTAALSATYSNGTAGVGATLTNSGTQVALAIDGVTLAVGNRVLVKDQASTLQNGIYTVTNIGSGSTNWIITRASDYDNSTDGNVAEGTYALISEGTVNAGKIFYENGSGPFTIGTTPITFLLSKPYPYTTLFTGSTIYTGGGSDTVGDGSIYAPYATLSHAMLVASPGDTISILQNITDTDIAWKRDVLVVSPIFATVTCDHITLDSSFSSSGSLVWDSVNFTVNNPVTLDFSGYNNTNIYYIRPLNSTLTYTPQNATGLIIKGLLNSGNPVVFFNPEKLQTASPDNFNSYCDISLDFGTNSILTSNVLGSVIFNCNLTGGSTLAMFLNNIVVGNMSGQGIILNQADNSYSGSSIAIQVYNTLQESPPLFNTFNNSNAVYLDQDAMSYVVPGAVGSGVANTNYFIYGAQVADAINFGENSTLSWTPTNFTPTPDPRQYSKTLTMMLSGIDTKLGSLASVLPNNYLYGFPVANGSIVSQLQVVCTSDMQAMASTNDSAIVSTNTTLFISNGITGIGGVDVGTFAANTNYNIFVCWDSTRIVSNGLIASLSTTPDLSGTGLDKFRQIGSWKTKLASTDFVQKIQSGLGTYRTYDYVGDPAESQVYSGSNTTFTEVLLLPWVSPTTLRGLLSYRLITGVSSGSFIITPHGNSNINRKTLAYGPSVQPQGEVAFIVNKSTVSIDVEIADSASAVVLSIASWDEQL